MATVYLTTDVNRELFLPGAGNIEYCLKLIITEMIECLNSNGINYVNESDRMMSDLDLPSSEESVRIILGTHSQPGPLPGETSGIFIFFTEGDPKSKRLATILSKNLGNIYPDPSLVKIMSVEPSQAPGGTFIPSVTVKMGYTDNPDDMAWLRENLEEIAVNMVMSLSEYFGSPFTQCKISNFGIVNQDTNIMQKPNLDSEIVESLAANTKIKVLGQWENWYIVDHNHNLGYVPTKSITT